MDSKDYILVDLIADVVDSMREIGVVDSFTEDTQGVYTIQSSNTLTNKEVIVINSVDYIVTNATENSFTINGVSGIDFTGLSWKAKAPYYEHGHILEIANTLNKKDKGKYTYQKYPLIILFQDYEVNKSISEDAIFGTTSARLAIVNLTRPELVSKDRYDYNFREKLFPLYDEFMNALVEIDYFNTSPNYPFVNNVAIERPYWGSDIANNNQNILNDYIDAIELQNVELQILKGIKNC